MNEAQVFLAGYVAREPKFRKTHNGYSYTSLRVGYTPRRMDRDSGEWSDSGTSFVTVFCWRGLADNVATCVRKGDPVLVKGKLQVRPFTDKDGASRVAVEVEASSIGHDLARGVANFQRAHRTAGETALQRAADVTRPGEAGPQEAGPDQGGPDQGGPDDTGVPAAPGDGRQAAHPGGMFAEDAVAALAATDMADDPDDDAQQAAADAAEPGTGGEAVAVAAPF
jgi:single-strand DNA-binding protein